MTSDLGFIAVGEEAIKPYISNCTIFNPLIHISQICVKLCPIWQANIYVNMIHTAIII